jgi:aldehyde:ferredoxin oxidoreductase
MKSEHRKNMYANGQTGSIVPREENGLLPIKNWTLGEWRDGAAKIGQPTYNEVLNAKPKSCAFCPMGCKRWVKIDDGEWYDHEGHGPEYETLAMLGSSLLIDDLKKISYANYLCDSFGIDTMSVAGIIGMIFELYEKGIIDNNYLDGIKAEWGNADAMIELVKKIGISEGIGKILNKGVKYLSKLWDNSYEELDLEVRGLEIPAHDPRAFHSMAVTYATLPRGACHMHGYSGAISLGRLIPEMGIDEQVSRFSSNKKGRAAVVFQDIASMHNSLTWCMTLQGANFLYDKQIELLNAITGWEFDIKEFCKTGERITNLQQLINLKRGLTREDIKLPRRFRTGLNEGGTKGTTPEFEVMMEEYLQVREWDNNAIPTEKKLRELNLEDYAK